MKTIDDIFMVLEKYKETIKFLHHTIKDKNLTPDERLEREDVFTNQATKAIELLIAEARIEELNLIPNKSNNRHRDNRLATLKSKVKETI